MRKFEIKRITLELLQGQPLLMFELNELLSELNARSPVLSWLDLLLEQLLEQPRSFFFGAFLRIGKIIRASGANTPYYRLAGLAELHIHRTLTYRKGTVENVVVGNEFRGQGLADALTLAIKDEAKKQGLHFLELTSKAARVAAHQLYLKCGFTKRDTDCFRLTLKPR